MVLSLGSGDDIIDNLKRPALWVQLAQWAVRNDVTNRGLETSLSILKSYRTALPIDPYRVKKTPITYVI